VEDRPTGRVPLKIWLGVCGGPCPRTDDPPDSFAKTSPLFLVDKGE